MGVAGLALSLNQDPKEGGATEPTMRKQLMGLPRDGVLRLPTVISPNYVRSWGKVEAIREIIQNALDTNTKWSAKYDRRSGKAVIADKGPGLEFRDLLLGVSRKGGEQIGQFGEGLLLAMSVCARENSSIVVETVGFSVEATMEDHPVLGEPALTLFVKRNNRRVGTKVEIECTEEEFEKAKRLFLEVVKCEKKHLGDGVFLPGGDIYVVGLKTTHIESVFSYNLRNKDLTNRDRTIIDMPKAEKEIQEILSNTSSIDVIKAFLENAEKFPHALEYRIDIEPRNIMLWKQAIQELWPKAVTRTTGYNDFVAECLGYKVLMDVSVKTQRFLNRLGVPSSDIIASQHGGEAIVLDETKIVYPITESYATHWTMVDALREVIANARDASEKVKIDWNPEDQVAIISDEGSGLQHDAFIFGGGTPKGEDKIGQFADGLKMAALVAARSGRKFEVITKGFTYEATWEFNSAFSVNLLAIYARPNRRRKPGTTVLVGCAQHELEAAKKYFRPIKDPYELEPGIIQRQPGERAGIYIQGMLAGEIKAFYSYSLADKTLTNRDRRVVDQRRAEEQIKRILYGIKRYKTVRNLLAPIATSNEYYLEYELLREIPGSPLIDLISKAVLNLFTRQKICLAVGYPHDHKARERGWRPINFNAPIVHVLRYAGMMTSAEVASRVKRSTNKDGYRRYRIQNFSKEEREVWQVTTRRWRRLFPHDTPKLRLVDGLPEGTFVSPLGGWMSYDPKTNTAYLTPSALASKRKLMGELVAISVLKEAIPFADNDGPRTDDLLDASLRLLRRLATKGWKD